MLKNIKNAPEIFRDDCSRYHPGYRPMTSVCIKQREGNSRRSPRSRPLTGTNRLRQKCCQALRNQLSVRWPPRLFHPCARCTRSLFAEEASLQDVLHSFIVLRVMDECLPSISGTRISVNEKATDKAESAKGKKSRKNPGINSFEFPVSPDLVYPLFRKLSTPPEADARHPPHFPGKTNRPAS